MAKPILVIKVPIEMPTERAKEISNNVTNTLQGEYHVLVVSCLGHMEKIQFECVNGGSVPEITKDVTG
jgi:hypothetical protein